LSANSHLAKSTTADNFQRLVVVHRNLGSSIMNVNRRFKFELTIVCKFLLPCVEFLT
jgi:hypothetical protein